jgi:hypothetical protein
LGISNLDDERHLAQGSLLREFRRD